MARSEIPRTVARGHGAEAGANVVTDDLDRSQLWFEVGQAHFELGRAPSDKNAHDQAIAAFNKAIDARADFMQARFACGDAYFLRGDLSRAKLDLEAYVATPSSDSDDLRLQATIMLNQIDAKRKR